MPAVPVWDASEMFKKNRFKTAVFNHDEVTRLPRVKEELNHGDLVMVYYSASTYVKKNNNSQECLSLNLYGVVRLCAVNDSAFA